MGIIFGWVSSSTDHDNLSQTLKRHEKKTIKETFFSLLRKNYSQNNKGS